MAEIGKGDPRWLVENRDDGRNVNNWHWTEANLTPWAKEELTNRLKDLVLVDDEKVLAKIKKSKNFDGDVTVSNRKGKVFYYYDLSIELEWEGELKDESLKNCQGKIFLSDIEQDSQVEDFEFRLNVTGAETEKHREIKDAVKSKGIKALGAVIAEFNTNLRERAGVAQAGKAAANNDVNSGSGDAQEKRAVTKKLPAIETVVETVELADGKSLKTCKFSLTHKFRCRPSDLVECFTDVRRVQAFTQDSSVKVAAKAGEPFALYDNAVSGSLVSFDDKSIVLDWRLSAWPRDLVARIEMQLQFDDDQTKMTFKASRVPAGEKDNTTRAWDHFYWQRIRAVFGFR